MPPKLPVDGMADADPAAGAMAPVVRLHPIRVLVVSTDLPFHDRSQVVLGALGSVICAVASLDEPRDVASLAVQERADVVLLDATDCEHAAPAVIRALAEAAPRAGVLSVCHHCSDASRELGALPKWGWTQDLRAGVEHAYRAGNARSPLALRPLRRRPQWQRVAGPLRRS